MPAARPARSYRAFRAAVTPLYRLLFRIDVEGVGHIPRRGPAIVAANHLSFFDSVALTLSMSRQLVFLGKAEYLDSWKTRWLFPALGMIPIERRDGRQAMAALDTASEVLARGDLLGIYPEGTRSRDGLLHRGHSGVAHLALTTGAPIVPAGLIGTDVVQPAGASTPRPFTSATVRFGRPIHPLDYGGRSRRRRTRITDDLMAAIHGLTGQERSPDFSSDEPPLIRGGTESVYLVVPVLDRDPGGWQAAATRAVGDVCGRYDDARVGEVRGLRCHVDRAGRFEFEAEMAVSTKCHEGSLR